MRCGLFGKLPAKRDFIAADTPRDFLNVWEPWMQAAMSASRQALGEHWQSAFLTAPIWRFWLGAELCGTSVAGALMPSLDGVGRYFPLTLVATADEGTAIPPPELDPQDPWFVVVEEFLLSALDRDAEFDKIMAALDRLPVPAAGRLPAATPDRVYLAAGSVAKAGGNRSVSEILAALRVADHAKTYASATFWWTIGGEGYEPLVLSNRRMPDPFLYAEMLTGRFAFGFE